MKNVLRKDTVRDIKKSIGRFISILSIVALGVAFFTGVKVSPIVMMKNADKYYDENNLMDIRLISTLGLTDGDVEEIKKIEGIEGIAPSYFKNLIADYGKSEKVIVAHSFPNDNLNDSNDNYINRLTLVDGRMPANPGECVVEKTKMEDAQIPIGSKIKLSTGTSEDINDVLAHSEYEVVGTVETPYYLSYEKGTASIGSGDISSYIMIPEDDFKSPAYTEIFLTVSGAKELNSYKDKYFDVIDPIVKRLEDISGKRNDIRFEEVKKESIEKFESGKKEFEEKEKEAYAQLDSAKATIDSSKSQLESGEKELATQKENFNIYIKQKEDELLQGKISVAVYESTYTQKKAEIEKYNEYIATEQKKIDDLVQKKQDLEKEYESNQSEAIKIQIETINNTINISQKVIDEFKGYIDKAQKELDVLKSSIDEAKVQLEDGSVELEKGKITAEAQFKLAEEKLAVGKEELAKGEEEYNAKKSEAEKELQIAREKLQDAEKKINSIEKPEWIILDRNSHYSYVDYKSSAESIDALAAIFPVFFFLVAALVCLTTMTRMVDEQRVNIGTLKALGYSKGAIASKFIVYALSASIVGSLIGIAIGFTVFPLVIFNAYGIMYTLPPVKLILDIPLAFGATAAAVLVTTLSALGACYKELLETPSVLMRPKAPKNGKRILIERIPFIWNKLNFIGKVTIRNIFRYKKRFFMTVFGIAGCTALLLTGFGIKDSIKTIVDKQFGSIFMYDTGISLDTDIVNTQKEDINTTLSNESRIERYTYMSVQNGKLSNDDTSKDVSIIVPEEINDFEQFISLRERTSKKKITLTNDGAVISEKVAKQLDVKVGDNVKLKDKDDKEVTVKVIGIAENYVTHYVYMTKEYYEQVFGKDPEFLSIYTQNKDDISDEDSLVKSIISLDGVVGANNTSSIKSTFNDTIKSLNLVVIILIISAGSLAFVVLYNLTNVNISERMREIATIKVLGFYDNEVSAYIYRENIILTVVGALTGLGLGVILHRFIMVTVEIDNMMFGRNIDALSFILSIVLTLGFALLVNLAMYYKLKNVQMVESLKSVD